MRSHQRILASTNFTDSVKCEKIQSTFSKMDAQPQSFGADVRAKVHEGLKNEASRFLLRAGKSGKPARPEARSIYSHTRERERGREGYIYIETHIYIY